MARYRKKAVEVDGFQFCIDPAASWFAEAIVDGTVSMEVTLKSSEGTMILKYGDYVLAGVEGEIYSCKQSVMDKTYEEQ